MKLNLGSGAIASPLQGWTSLDAMAWPVNVRADIRSLPFKDQSCEAIHCAHVIEHIPEGDVTGTLSEMRRVLQKNGILYISGPDTTRAQEARSEYWVRVSHWGGVTAGWQHEWDCNIFTMRDHLERAGFMPSWAASVPQGWPPNTHQWPQDFEVRFLCRRNDCSWPKSFPQGFVTVL